MFRMEIPMIACRWCSKPFEEVKPWQVYCCERCQQDWHLHQRKLARQEKLFAKLVKQEEFRKANGVWPTRDQLEDRTPEQRQQAKEVLSRIVREQQPRFQRRI
jgi:hypothetical protein